MIKEEASMKLLALPEAPRLTQWQQHLRDKVVSVSGRGDEAFLWIREAEDMEIPDVQLAVSQKFASVDAKLAAAFHDILALLNLACSSSFSDIFCGFTARRARRGA